MLSLMNLAKGEKYLLLIAAFFLGGLYFLSRNAYYVGIFNDDAFAIIGARSLTQGRYVELNQPGNPPIVDYTPGTSLLLAPVAAFKPTSFLPYQMVSILLMVGGFVLFWLLYKPHLQMLTVLSALFLTALSPMAVSLSGTVLSDIGYFFISGAVFLAGNLYEKKPNSLRLYGLAILCAFGFYIRPIGGAFVLTWIIRFAWKKNWKAVIPYACITGLLILPYLIRNQLLRGQWLPLAVEYGSGAESSAAAGALASSLLSNLQFYSHELFVTNLFRWPYGFPSVLSPLTAGLCAVLFLLGVKAMRSKKQFSAAAIYGAIYIAVLMFWDRQCSRYILPVVPLVLICLMEGARLIEEKFRWRGTVRIMLVGVAFLFYFPTLRTILNASISGHTPLNTPSIQTFEWINRNTNPGAVFATEWDGRFYLYTGRPCYHLPRTLDRMEFLRWVGERKVDYLLLSPVDMIVRTNSGNAAYEPISVGVLEAFMKGGKEFQKIYENADEGTQVYQRTRP